MTEWKDVCPMAAIEARAREDELWLITCGVLVLTMQAAFALVEVGAVRSMNVGNIMMKNMIDLVVGGLMWYLIGYYIAFDETGEWSLEVSDTGRWFFQWSFAATCATIDSGTVAERVRFLPYVLISMMTTGFIYPIVAHLVWHPDGYLNTIGFHDFAGSAGVHMLGGFSAVTFAAVLGPRIGRFTDYTPSRSSLAQVICRRSADPDYYIPPLSIPPIQPVTDPISLVFGVFFLLVGWYGFNPGSTGGTEGAKTYVASRIVMNTTMGALGGGTSAFLYLLCTRGPKSNAIFTPDGLGLGILAGLVACTAGNPWFSNRDSLIIGALGHLTATHVEWLLKRLHIDDVVSAVAIHGGAGLTGTIAVAFFAQEWSCSIEGGFANPVGIFYAASADQMMAWRLLGKQLWGCFIIASIGCSCTFLILVVFNQIPCLTLRLGRAEELFGIDEAEHDAGHDDVDFAYLMANLVHRVAEGNDILAAFQQASRAIVVHQEMDRLKDERSLPQAGANLDVTVQSASSLSCLNDQNGFRQRILRGASSLRVVVKLLLARPPARGSAVKETDDLLFAPRYTKPVQPGTGIEWEKTFNFPNVRLFTSCLEDAFLTFTLFQGANSVGQAHVPLRPDAWPGVRSHNSDTLDSEPIFCTADLPLLPAHCSGKAPLNSFVTVRLAFPNGIAGLYA